MNKTHLSKGEEQREEKQRLFLSYLAAKGISELFISEDQRQLRQYSLEGRAAIVTLLSRLLKAGFRLVVYLTNGNRYGLKDIRLNKEGCIGLTLMVTGAVVQPVTLRPLLLHFHPASRPDMSFFTLIPDPSFPAPVDLELLEQSLLFFEVEEVQPSPEGYGKTVSYVQSAEEQEEQRLATAFIQSFSLQGTSPLYIFFRASPFNFLQETQRNGLLSKGSEGLKKGIDLIA